MDVIFKLPDTFWDPFGRFLDAFGVPIRARDTQGSYFGDFLEFHQKSVLITNYYETPFCRVVTLLPTFWQSVFTSFSDSLIFRVFPTFWKFRIPFGVHLACFLEGLGTSEMEPELRREYDSHTLGLLFSGPNSRLEFTADFFETFCTFRHFGVPFGDPFGSLCLERPIEHYCAKKVRKKATRGNPGNSKWGVLAPKEEDLRPPSSLKACRI